MLKMLRHVLLLKTELELNFEHFGLQGRTIYVEKENNEIYEIVKIMESNNKPYCVKWFEDLNDIINDGTNPVILL